MVEIKATIKLYENGRRYPIYSGYSPACLFKNGDPTSGSIHLINKERLEIGSSDQVIIRFLHREFLGIEFNIGSKFIFYESPQHIIGEGIVDEIIGGNGAKGNGQ